MFGFCVVITVSLAGFIWFRSFEENIFVLMNTDEAAQEQFYAERAENTPALLATLGTSYQNLRAAVSGFLLLTDLSEGDKNNTVNKNQDESIKSSEKTYMLPVK